MVAEANYPRLTPPPKGSFFLFGVRGVGKSTWTRACFPDAHYLDLLDETRYQALTANPGLLAHEVDALPPRRVVVIDEVQRVPALLNEVHRAIENSRRRFVLLGSSARRFKTSTTNLLGGRAVLQTMYPLVPAELGDDFNLERVLKFGSIPIAWRAANPRATLDAYVQLYVREEIRAEALVRNLPGFLRFLPVAALCHGRVINVAGIARDAMAARTTVEGYLGILQDTLLATLLPAFETQLRVRERRHPKLYWVDPGVVRAARRQTGLITSHERGELFEGWILSLLRAHDAAFPLFDDIAYWSPADAHQTEVDFVLSRGRDHLAIEVKSNTHFSPKQLAGLKAIAALPRLRRRILVYLGRERLQADGIDVWPLRMFLNALEDERLWP